jgi:short-subunit dehydrogenase
LQLVANGNADTLVLPFDITQSAEVLAARDTILAKWAGIDLVLIVAGTYQKMRAEDFNLVTAKQLVDTNLNGPLNCLDAVLPVLLAQGRGAIGIVASIAGLSGLPQALIYGPTKAALINLCESLYLDLRPRGIGVYLINPGFVATPLTAQNEFAMPALISAETAATEFIRGLERGDFHIHFPRRFTNWLRLLRLLPYRLYFWLIHKGTGL